GILCDAEWRLGQHQLQLAIALKDERMIDRAHRWLGGMALIAGLAFAAPALTQTAPTPAPAQPAPAATPAPAQAALGQPAARHR
ncbi:hypothetical protein, partial [Klebsiella pneumoniae]|uniref:hypothetical protein n=1 Tax=Klebsiella pneumoniae TaxID=573 RepID=UPI003EE23538